MEKQIMASVFTIHPQAGEKLRIRLEGENIIDSSFDYIGRIMEVLDRSTYET